MADYSVQVTYKTGRTTRTRGYVVDATSKAEAVQKGRTAHREQGEPGTPVTQVRAEQL